MLVLGRASTTISRNEQLLEELRGKYERTGFLQVPGVLDPEPLEVLARSTVELERYATQIAVSPTIRDDVLLAGQNSWRLDAGPHPGSRLTAEEQRELHEAFVARGYFRVGAEIARAVGPILRNVVGDYKYERVYFLLYHEGDYIGPHTDGHVGDRVNIQFPVLLDAHGAIRVLEGDSLRFYYDEPGCLRVLGPSIWHDVPPVMRANKAQDARRVVVSLRFGRGRKASADGALGGKSPD